MSVSSTDKGLLTPENCLVIFIDPRPQTLSSSFNNNGQDLLNNALVLAKTAKIFGMPVILSAVRSKGSTGKIISRLLDLFPDHTPIEHSSMNAWDSKEFTDAVKKAGRRNLLIAAFCNEVCLAMPALQALTDGYGVYVVVDASGGSSTAAQGAAIRRIEQAGGVSVTALQVLLELQRDWGREEHYAEVMNILDELHYVYTPCTQSPGDP